MGDIDINKYNKYTNDFTAIFDTYEEIIYICNKFDINRINRFLIYTIENYNYYLPERGYSDTANALSNRDNIIKSSEYTEITEDIQKNFDKIILKCDELYTKIEKFVREYLDNLGNSDNKLITDNFKSQFNRINTNLKNLVIELEKIKAKDDSEIDSDISFNIYPITKSSMMLKMYSTAKMIFKNLHIINSDESEPTAEDLETFNTNLNNINKELIKKFNDDIVVINQKDFKQQIILLSEAQKKLERKFKDLKDEEKKEKEKERKGKEGEDGEDGGGEDGEGGGRDGEGDGEDKGKYEGRNESLNKKKEAETARNTFLEAQQKAEEAKKEADETKKKAEDAQKALESAQNDGGNDIKAATRNVELAQDALKKAQEALVAAQAAEEANRKAAEEAARLAAEAAEAARLAEAAAAEEKRKAEEEKRKKEEEEKRKKEEEAKNKVSFIYIEKEGIDKNKEKIKQEFEKLVTYLKDIINDTANKIWIDNETENKTLFITTVSAKLEELIKNFAIKEADYKTKSHYGQNLLTYYNVNETDLSNNKSRVVFELYKIIRVAIQEECEKQDKNQNNTRFTDEYNALKLTIHNPFNTVNKTYDEMVNFLQNDFIRLIEFYIELKNPAPAPGAPPGAPPGAQPPGAQPLQPIQPAPEEPKVFNFKYNNNSCYVHSLLQMILDNKDLCEKINEKKVNTEPTDKSSSQYLLYLLQQLIEYHSKNLYDIGDTKNETNAQLVYDTYILPIRKFFNDIHPDGFRIGNTGDPLELLDYILNTLDIKNPYDCFLFTDEQNFTYNNTKKNKESNDTIRQIRLLIPSSYVGGSNMGEFIDICMKRIQDEQIKICAENIEYNNNPDNIEKRYEYLDYIEPPQCKNLIISTARINKNDGVEEVNKKIITLSKELNLKYYKITSKKDKEDIIKYRLQSFICYEGKNNGGHYVYYKSLSPDTNNDDDKWVKLNDTDKENNGTIVNQSTLPNNTGVLYYYTRVGESPKTNVENNAPQPVVVANATGTPFKYSFETLTNAVNNNTPIYNSSDKPYYLDANKKTPAKFMASLNAGDENLYVGGSQINHAFNCAISGENINNSVNDKELNDLSIEMHTTFYTVVNSTPGIAGKIYKYDDLQSNHNSNIYFEDMYLYKSEKLLDKFKFANNIYPGDVFIEILKNKTCINGGGEHINNMTNIANKAMIYCVGPNGNVFKNGKDVVENEFLKAINIIGKNIANAINEYNKYDGNDNKKIDYVRICLISGNLYLPSSMKVNNKTTENQVKVAEELIKGIHSVNKKNKVKGIVYNFAYADGVFQTAFDKLKKTPEYKDDTTFVKLNIT